MRYISQVISEDRQQLQSLEYLLVDPPVFRLKIADTNADKILEEPLGKLVDAIGFGVDERFHLATLLVHNRKTAMLHRYVKSVVTEFHKVPVWRPDSKSDKAIHTAFDTDIYVNAKDRWWLDCSLRDNYIVALTPDGGVCQWRSYGSDVYIRCTLYDLLVFMCRELHLNLMKYSEIQFGNEDAEVLTTLKLAQTDEAKRFYTKMMFDVTGDYVHGKLPEDSHWE